MEVKIKVPESLAEITVRQYLKFLKIEKDNSNDQFIRQKMIEIFCDVPGTVVLKMKHNDFTDISNHLINVLMEKPDFRPTFKMNGKEYGFIPNMKMDIQVQEYVDLDMFLGEEGSLNRIMGVLYRPITSKKGGKYKIEDYEAFKYDEIMMDAPMDVTSGALVFFYRLGNQLLRIIPKYLEREIAKGKREVDLAKNMDGISTSINLLEDSSSALRMLLSANLEKHCFSLRTTGI